MDAQAQSAGIASIKTTKRKYTKRKPKAKVIAIKPKARKTLPKTASAYLRTLGMAIDKENVAVSELIRLHSELAKKEEALIPEYREVEPTAPVPVSFWKRWLFK